MSSAPPAGKCPSQGGVRGGWARGCPSEPHLQPCPLPVPLRGPRLRSLISSALSEPQGWKGMGAGTLVGRQAGSWSPAREVPRDLRGGRRPAGPSGAGREAPGSIVLGEAGHPRPQAWGGGCPVGKEVGRMREAWKL